MKMSADALPTTSLDEQHIAESEGKLEPAKLGAYGGLALPLALAEVPILLYLPAFYAQEVGISTALVGLAFLFARLWDGFADLTVGWLSDRTRSRWGRRKPWVMYSVPFLMLSTWLLCNPPAGAGVAYLVLAAVFFYTADAAMKIPYHSWGAELAADYVERSRVTGYRETFAMFGNLLFVTAPLILLASDAPLSKVLFLITITLLVVLPIASLPLALCVQDETNSRIEKVSLGKVIVDLYNDKVLLTFMGCILLINLSNGVINSLAVFAFGIGVGLPDKLFWLIFIHYVSTICAVPLTLRLARSAEKHQIFALGTLIMAAAYAAHLFVPYGNFPIVAVLWLIAGFGNAAMLILPTSILADIIDHSEVSTGERRSGGYMAIYNLIKKIGMALGVGVAFGALGLIGFEASAEQHSATDAQNIRLVAYGLSSLLFLPAIWIIFRHPITRIIHDRLREEINLRSKIEAGDGAA
jgi:Na+/melibiose symporter-like transporter